MVDPFINPMDTAPVRRLSPAGINNATGSGAASAPGMTFKEILQKKYEQSPTPIITPESLMPPVIGGKPAETVPAIQANEEELQGDVLDKSPVQVLPTAPAPVITDVASASQEPKDVEETPTNTLSQNLSQLLKQQTAAPESSVPMEEDPALPIEIEATPEPEPTPTVPANEPILSDDELDVTTRYTVEPGDTLSGIISAALKAQGVPYTTSDIYKLVDVVAQENDLRNPNRIYPGQELNLTSVFVEAPLAESNGQSLTTAMMDTIEHGDFQSPANGRVSSTFGARQHPIYNDERFHNGVDIAVPEGTPVRPFKPGVVAFSGERGGYGNLIEVDHGDGTSTRYGHLSQISVAAGDAVDRNTLLGQSGNTGTSTGPHLHFELRRSGRPIDPLAVLPVEMIESRVDTSPVRLAQAE